MVKEDTRSTLTWKAHLQPEGSVDSPTQSLCLFFHRLYILRRNPKYSQVICGTCGWGPEETNVTRRSVRVTKTHTIFDKAVWAMTISPSELFRSHIDFSETPFFCHRLINTSGVHSDTACFCPTSSIFTLSPLVRCPKREHE